jgi:protein-disulfide isomerase
MMKDDRLIHVDDEVRRKMREFGDAIFEEVSQAEIDAKWREYQKMKAYQMEGLSYVAKF